MLKIIPAFFWVLFFILIFSNFFYGGGRVDVPSATPERTERFSSVQERLWSLHNEMRGSKGMKPLVIDERLCEYAQKHAVSMAKKGSMYHSSMDALQKFCGRDVVGENVAWGQSTEEEVFSDWMWSPGHRWNILGSSYDRAGFGVAKDDDGRNYWCVVFAG